MTSFYPMASIYLWLGSSLTIWKGLSTYNPKSALSSPFAGTGFMVSA